MNYYLFMPQLRERLTKKTAIKPLTSINVKNIIYREYCRTKNQNTKEE